MSKLYLLTSALVTSDIGSYIKDVIEQEFNTQLYSVPSSDYGFDKVVDEVDESSVRATLETRIKNILSRVSNSSGVTATLTSMVKEGINSYKISINVKDKEYEVNVSI